MFLRVKQYAWVLITQMRGLPHENVYIFTIRMGPVFYTMLSKYRVTNVNSPLLQHAE